MASFCTACGRETKADDRFCGGCGTALEKPLPVEDAAPTPALDGASPTNQSHKLGWADRTFEGGALTMWGCLASLALFIAICLLVLRQCSPAVEPAKEEATAENSAEGSPQRDPAEKARSDAVDVRVAAERNLRASLNDGDSAKVEGLFVSRLSNGAMALCGKVNAKNGFGAYTGFKRFVAPAASDAPTLVEGNPLGLGAAMDRKAFRGAYSEFCSRQIMAF